MAKYLDLTLERAVGMMPGEEYPIQGQLMARISSVQTAHDFFVEWCRRADNLYFTTDFTDWGADLWPDDPSATTEGRSHVSINQPPVYVDVPAALQAQEPTENMMATEDSPEARSVAQALERVRKAWKVENKWQLKFHKTCTIKALYGMGAGFVYWDADKGYPCNEIVQNPRNLYLGYKSDDYDEIEWAAYVTMVEPGSLQERYSVEVGIRAVGNGRFTIGEQEMVPWVMPADAQGDRQPRPILNYGPARVEVWDYWYRVPGKPGKRGKPTKMETWNVVVAGNEIVSGPYHYPEYKGVIPYKPVYNTYIPGVPLGRPELWDMEQLIREAMERVTSGSQVIAGATAGDYWQLTGPDAPSRVPPQAKPKRNEVAAPGAGNRIETITPFIAQYQLEQYLGRIDRYSSIISGLNDMLLGLAPEAALSSSKAINALIANYEARISMRRLMLYSWVKDMWDLTVQVWGAKDKTVKSLLDKGGGVLDIIAPSLSPRDESETAIRAANLVNAKLWSQARGMDAVGVDDPEQEQNVIREERTDATMFPQDVEVMAQLLTVLQGIGQQAPQGVQDQAAGQVASGQAGLASALGMATPSVGAGQPSGPGDLGQTQPGALAPGATPPSGQGSTATLQGMITGGEGSQRIMTNTPLGGG